MDYMGEALISINNQGYIININEMAQTIFKIFSYELKGKLFQNEFIIFEKKNPKKESNLIDRILNSDFREKFIGENVKIALKSKKNIQDKFNAFLFPIRSDEDKLLGLILLISETVKKNNHEQLYQKIIEFRSIEQASFGVVHKVNETFESIINNLFILSIECNQCEKREIFNQILAEIKEHIISTGRLTYNLLQMINKTFFSSKGYVTIDFLEEFISINFIGININLNLEIEQNLFPNKIERSFIAKILNNIIQNAKDAVLRSEKMEKNVYIRVKNLEIKRSNKITLELVEKYNLGEGKYIKFEIEDNGVGMPPETMKMIFEPYFTTKSFIGSKGLGLIIVKNLIEELKGVIYVESQENKGTIMHLIIPVN
ncbi:MAG: sensor histidine kinase [Promethearchaeota archaeon]